MVEEQTPAKKKRGYDLVIALSVYRMLKFDAALIAWSPNVISPHLPTRRLIKTFLRFLCREFCHFSLYSF